MPAIEHVSDTARQVAISRAQKSERADAIFRSYPYARRRVGAVSVVSRGR